MKTSQFKSDFRKFSIYFRKDNEPAFYWAEKISSLISKKLPQAKFDNKNPEVLIILGGDGTILEGAKKYHHKSNPMIMGLNLGHVGFLASVREPKNFITGLDKFLKNKYSVVERMMLLVSVERRGKIIFSSEALNEMVIQNPLGMVDLDISANGTIIKSVRGTGALVSTATGSTAYNLSAHGPIISPDIKCMILTEIMTHSVPSPSFVLKYNQELKLKIKSFRKPEVILITDGSESFKLEEGDVITVKNSPHLVKFIELENNYFFKSLKEKFNIK